MTTISNAGPIWLVLTMVEAVYGGLHLLAWNASFSTVVERILWQISGITVTSLGPLCAIIGPLCTIIFYSVARFDDHAFKIRYHLHFGRGGVFRTPVQLLSTAFIVCYAVLYLLARVYLVVECFIELAYLPDSAFETPNFTLYIPHFG